MRELDRSYLISLIRNEVENRGNPMYLSRVGQLCQTDVRAYGIRQRYLSLKAMVEQLAPDVRCYHDERDVDWVVLDDYEFAEKPAEDMREGYPMVIDPNDAMSIVEVEMMHKFAFMGWWTTTYKKLKQLTGYSGNDYTVWSKIIARQWYNARDTGAISEHTYNVGGMSCQVCLFRTGLYTRDGLMIYAVLLANSDPDKQPWYLKEYTYPGCEDSEFGIWLLSVVDDKQATAHAVNTMDRVWSKLEDLKSMLPAVQEDLRRLAGGCLISLPGFTAVEEYMNAARRVVKSGVLELIQLPDQASMTIDELQQAVGGGGCIRILNRLEAEMEALIDRLDGVLTSWLGQITKKEDHILARIRSFMSQAGADLRRGGNGLHYVEQYARWADLLCAAVNTLWLGETTCTELIQEHFGIMPIMQRTLYNAFSAEEHNLQESVEQVQTCLNEFRQALLESDEPDEDEQQNASPDADRGCEEAIPAENGEPLALGIPGIDLPEHMGEDSWQSDNLFEMQLFPDLEMSVMTPVITEDLAKALQEEYSGIFGTVTDTPKPAPKTEEQLPEQEIIEERITVRTGLDEAMVERCASGEESPQYESLRFGKWKFDGQQEAASAGKDVSDIAYGVLSDERMRTEQNLALCVQEALRSRRTQMAAALVNTMPAGWRRNLYALLLGFCEVANTTHEARQLDLLSNRFPTQLRQLLEQIREENYRVKREVFLSVLAHVPQLITNCFQPYGVAELLRIIKEYGESMRVMNELKIQREFVRLLESVQKSDDFEYDAIQYRNMTATLVLTYNQENRENALQRLRAKGRDMKKLFENCSIAYKSARLVVINFSTPTIERPYNMLQCLINGKAWDNVKPFEDDFEMRDYANASQSKIPELKTADDISGPAATKVVDYLRELNNAYKELQSLTGSDVAEIDPRHKRWCHQILTRLNQWKLILKNDLNENMQDGTFRCYLNDLCEQPAGEQNTHADYPMELCFESESTDCWPIDDGDLRIAALFELSGRMNDLTSCQVSRDIFEGVASDAQLLRITAMLQEKCSELVVQLDMLTSYSMIDLHEYKALMESLSCVTGWLRRTYSCLDEKRSMEELVPLVRYELDMWYVDQRIKAIFDVAADEAKRLLQTNEDDVQGEQTEELRLLEHEINKAVARRDMQYIAERFMDAVTNVSSMKPNANLAEVFFSKGFLDALCQVCNSGEEKWRKGTFQFVTNDVYRLNQREASMEEAKLLGRALHYARQYPTAPESMTEERLKEVEALFAFLGFGDPELSAIGEDFSLTTLAPDRSFCPLPQLGIGIAARKDQAWRVNYRVRIMPDAESVASLLSSAPESQLQGVTILLCPFAISFQKRRELLEIVRGMQTSRDYFLLDQCFLRYAMCMQRSDRLRAFYACTANLMRLEPYSVSTAGHWEGTFFGRENEINRLLRMDGCSVIYGGRRLGKTSIMREVEFRWFNQGENHIALYVNLQHNPPRVMWYRIAKELANYIPELEAYGQEAATESKVNEDAESIMRIISDFLREKNYKLLLLLDECDDLVYLDTVRVYDGNQQTSRLGELIRLRQENSSNFKVVLAGLECVTRFVRNLNAFNMARSNNDPVYQCFDEKVRVQPLLDYDMENAYDLVDVPFKMMGYHLEHRSVLYILRVCCFRPNLIQNYCRWLLETVRSRSTVTMEEGSLYMRVPHEIVRRIQENYNYSDEHYQQSIRIPLNVGATAVYAPVAYAVALLSTKNSVKGMFSGFSVYEVHSTIDGFNPAFSKGLSRAQEYIQTILEELVLMGVLRQIKDNNGSRYALFSSYMLKLLGDSRTIEEQLKECIDTHIQRREQDQGRRELFSQRRNIDGFLHPLTVGQQEKLYCALEEDGYAVVVGSDMLGLDEVRVMLGTVRFGSSTMEIMEKNAAVFDEEQVLDQYCAEINDSPERGRIVVLRGVWHSELPAWICDRHAQYSGVRFVLLVSPDDCRRMLDELDRMPESNLIHLHRMTPSFRSSLFESSSIGRQEDETRLLEMTGRIGEMTGDWPELVKRFISLMQSTPQADFDEIADQFTSWLNSDQALEEIEAGLGIAHVGKNVWKLLEDLPCLHDALEFAGEFGLNADEVRTSVAYLQHLAVANVSGSFDEPETCRVTLEPFAVRLMQRRAEQ